MTAQTRTSAKIVRAMPPPEETCGAWVAELVRFSGVFSPLEATARMEAGEVSISTEGRARIRLSGRIGRGPPVLERVPHLRPAGRGSGPARLVGWGHGP